MPDKQINSLFNKFKGVKALIIGDVMLDKYLIGSASRISPEAPVPVVDIKEKTTKLGGAANVALNIKSLGATPLIYSVIGNDDDGKELIEKLKQENISSDGILTDDNRSTTVKNRVISNHQQVLRFDEETTVNISSSKEQSLIDSIIRCIDKQHPDVIIFEDYDKGVITEKTIKEVVNACNKAGIPTVVDPKKRNFLSYKEVTLFKPNLRELAEGLNVVIDKKDIKAIKSSINTLKEKLNHKQTLITLSEQGILFTDDKHNIHVKAHLRNISDVSGAGDTVVSVAALCLACEASAELLTQISNIAGGLVCEKPGVVSIEFEELKNESIKLLC